MLSPTNLTYDDQTPVELIQHNGYYQVGDKKFSYKISALEYASQTGQNVSWEFNTDVFYNLDWRTPSDIGLRELYRIRAQQIRDRYDYVVLCFSGGSDSTTVLKSFLDNGIRLDEIIVEWPNSLIRTEISVDPSPENYIHEWALSIQPKLNYLQQHHPKIRITKVDLGTEIDTEDNEDTCTFILHHDYYTLKRYRAIDRRLQEISNKHANMCAILGVEKPWFKIDRNVLSCYFVDSSCYFRSSLTTYPRNIEYFFWARELPEIVKTQAQIVYRYLCQHPEYIWLFSGIQYPLMENNRSDYAKVYSSFKAAIRLHFNIVKSLIYPDWDINTFQADKHDSHIKNNQYNLIALPDDSREIQSWKSSLHSRWNLIDDRFKIFFDTNKKIFKDYQKFGSRAYPLGILPQVNTI